MDNQTWWYEDYEGNLVGPFDTHDEAHEAQHFHADWVRKILRYIELHNPEILLKV